MVITENQKCYNESLKAKGDKPLTKWAVERVSGKEGAPWKAFESYGKRTVRTSKYGNIFAEKEHE